MRAMSVERRKVVVMAGSTAALSGAGPVLLRGHHYLRLAWIGFVAVMLVVVIIKLVKLQREERC